MNDDETKFWCEVYVAALPLESDREGSAARARADEAISDLRERRPSDSAASYAASPSVILDTIARAAEIERLRDALRSIAEHGYLSERHSSAAEIVHSMDWMIDTAIAAYRGDPLPVLKDAPTGGGADSAGRREPEVPAKRNVGWYYWDGSEWLWTAPDT